MKLRYFVMSFVLGFLAELPIQASAELLIEGTLYSITSDDFVINSNNRLYYLRKTKLHADIQGMLEKHPSGKIALHVPMQAIDDMKILKK
jgi:hypothetical protein